MQVYATLAAAVLLSAFGVATNITLQIGGFLTMLLAFGSLTWLAFTPASPQNLVSTSKLQSTRGLNPFATPEQLKLPGWHMQCSSRLGSGLGVASGAASLFPSSMRLQVGEGQPIRWCLDMLT